MEVLECPAQAVQLPAWVILIFTQTQPCLIISTQEADAAGQRYDKTAQIKNESKPRDTGGNLQWVYPGWPSPGTLVQR